MFYLRLKIEVGMLLNDVIMPSRLHVSATQQNNEISRYRTRFIGKAAIICFQSGKKRGIPSLTDNFPREKIYG